MIKTENKLVSISNIDELRKKRDLNSLDKIVELVSENLRKIDNLEINNYDKNLFEEIIFDFIKNEQSIYIILNSKVQRVFKDIASLEEYNKDLKIINEYLEDYFNSCNEFFEELFPSTMRIFLNKFSDKLTIYTFNTPSLDDKKLKFSNLLTEMENDKDLTNIETFVNKINKYRE